MINPREFNAKWMSETGDGSLRPSDSRLTSAQQACQNLVRSYGDRDVKSKACIVLPQQVSEDMDKVRVFALGFEDRAASSGEVKSNGCAIQVHMQAEEEFSIDMFADSSGTQFEKVNNSRNSSHQQPVPV